MCCLASKPIVRAIGAYKACSIGTVRSAECESLLARPRASLSEASSTRNADLPVFTACLPSRNFCIGACRFFLDENPLFDHPAEVGAPDSEDAVLLLIGAVKVHFHQINPLVDEGKSARSAVKIAGNLQQFRIFNDL